MQVAVSRIRRGERGGVSGFVGFSPLFSGRACCRLNLTIGSLRIKREPYSEDVSEQNLRMYPCSLDDLRNLQLGSGLTPLRIRS